MAITLLDGVRLHWRIEGAANRPVLVLLHSIGTDLSLWDRTVPLLLPAFRLLRIDTRGAGGSDAPPGDYSLAMLADDIAAIMNDAGIVQAAVAGVSLGGMVAMQLALDHPERVSALVLICTSAKMDPAAWTARIDTVRRDDTAAIADMVVGRFLSRSFATRHPEIAETLRDGIARQSDDGYAGAGAAIRDMALAERRRTRQPPPRTWRCVGRCQPCQAHRLHHRFPGNDYPHRVGLDLGAPRLDDRTRRLLVLAITAALGRWEEFALHVRAGLTQGGFTTDELKEVLMQTAIYAGVPAANTGFAEAQKIIAIIEQES